VRARVIKLRTAAASDPPKQDVDDDNDDNEEGISVTKLASDLASARADIQQLRETLKEHQNALSRRVSLPPWILWPSSSALAQHTLLHHACNTLIPPISLSDDYKSYEDIAEARAAMLKAALQLPKQMAYGDEQRVICIEDAPPTGKLQKNTVLIFPATLHALIHELRRAQSKFGYPIVICLLGTAVSTTLLFFPVNRSAYLGGSQRLRLP
jgi:hypothetical protein